MWESPVPIFDDEDEAELIARFVELSARYPDHSPFEVTGVVFKHLRDPIMRSNQAAQIWSHDLDIIERIRQARLNGGEEVKPPETKLQKLAKLEAMYNDEKTPVRERLKAIELHARMQNEIDDDTGSDDGSGKRRLPVFNFAIHPGVVAAPNEPKPE